MRRRATVIVGVIVVILLAGGVAALLLWPEELPDTDLANETPSVAGETADLLNEEADDVVRVSFMPYDGSVFSIYRDPSSGDLELFTEDLVFSGDMSVMRTMFNAAIRLTNQSRLTEDADDSQLEMFGLNEPDMSISIERTDATAIELEVGAVQAAGQGRFVRIKNSREVFLLSARNSDILTNRIENVYDITFAPIHEYSEEQMALFAIGHILLETENDVFELRKRTDEELIAGTLGMSLFELLQPIKAEGNDYAVQTAILENILTIAPESIESVRPSDLSAYGLDLPARITITMEDWVGTLLIGKRDVERDGRFVMIEGHDAVLFAGGDYSFLNVSLSQLRSTLIWLNNITDVSSVTFELDNNVTRVLRLEHNAEDSSLQGWLDDVEISENNARRLYTAALRITRIGDTDEPIPDVSPMFTISMRFIDGRTDTLELYQLNETQFLVVRNNVSTGSFITRMALQNNLLGRFDILDDGGDLPG